MVKKYAAKDVKLLSNAVNNILFYDDVWTTALEGKKVLIVHPFIDTIRMQYEKRDKLFTTTKLPTFSNIEFVRAIQSNAGENNKIEFSSWFDALETMKLEIAKKDFEVALIAAGAYGLPLAAYVKGLGKQSIHMASNLQILFGIRGKRWDNWPGWAEKFNEYWVYPSENETPSGKNNVEGVEIIGNNENSVCLIRYLNMSSKRSIDKNRLTFFLKECVHNNEGRLVHEQTRKRHLEHIADRAVYKSTYFGRSFRTFTGSCESFSKRAYKNGLSGRFNPSNIESNHRIQRKDASKSDHFGGRIRNAYGSYQYGDAERTT